MKSPVSPLQNHMDDDKKTKEELIDELINLRKRVSDLEKLEFLHQKSEETMLRLSTVVRDSNDAITVQKLDGTILDWNHGAELIYGWKASEVIGGNIVCIIPEDRIKFTPLEGLSIAGYPTLCDEE